MPLPPWKSGETFWDEIILGGESMPGLANIETSVERSVQLSSPKDSDGVTLANNGYKGAKIRCTFRMWEDEQIEDFFRLLPLFHPAAGGDTRPVEILCPSAFILGVTQIYITAWRVPTPNSARDYFMPSFQAVQWFPGPQEAPQPPQVAPSAGRNSRPNNGAEPPARFQNPSVPPINPNFGAAVP